MARAMAGALVRYFMNFSGLPGLRGKRRGRPLLDSVCRSSLGFRLLHSSAVLIVTARVCLTASVVPSGIANV